MTDKIDIMLKKLEECAYFDYKYFYKDKQDFLKDLKLYLKLHPQKAYNLNILKDVVLYGIYDSKDINVFYLDRELPDNVPNYILDLQDIINTYKKDKVCALRKVKGVYSQSNFNFKIERFEKRFINFELYSDILLQIKNDLTYKETSKTTYTYVPLMRGDRYIIEDEVLQDIYESGLSLLDYAVQHKIDYVKLNVVIQASSKEELKKIRERENTVEDLLVDLIKKISNNEMDFIDYFRVCKLNPIHLKPFVTKYNLQCKEISTFINKNSAKNRTSLEKEEKSKLFINGIEVPYEIKKEAIDTINEVDAPLTPFNYSTVVKKLMKNRVK